MPADATEQQRFNAFVAHLPQRSQWFLRLLEERGTLTLSEAMDALGITYPKAMGDITGSIGRWAPVRGLEVPYATITIGGERAWRWTRRSATAEGE